MEDLISSMSNMIYHIARQFTNNDDLIKELYNQGVLGLYDAYNNYNKNSDTKFSSYAYMYIYGKIFIGKRHEKGRCETCLLVFLIIFWIWNPP